MEGEVHRCLSAQADIRGAAPAYILSDGRRITFQALAQAANSCREELENSGISEGHRVALALSDNPGFTAWYAGIQAIGALPCPIPPCSTPWEMRQTLQAIRPHCLVAEDPYSTYSDSENLLPAGSCLCFSVPAWTGQPDWPGKISTSKSLGDHDKGPQGSSIHLTYTGLGRPLGVVHDIEAHHCQARAVCEFSGLSQGDLALGVLPFANIFGFASCVLSPLYAGATVLLAHKARPPELLQLIEEHRPRFSYIVPALAMAMAVAQRYYRRDLSSLQRVWSGGSPIDAKIVDRFHKATGIQLWQGYGLTEAFTVCANHWSRAEVRPETLGTPFPHYQLRITDPAGNEVPRGVEGELEVRSRAVFSGYYNEPEATQAVLRAPGVLRTGDRAIMDPDGHVSFKGWIKRITKIYGYTVDLTEVEQVLRSLPGVDEVLLETEPRLVRGFILRAKIFAESGKINEDSLMEELSQRLSPYKIPRLVVAKKGP